MTREKARTQLHLHLSGMPDEQLFAATSLDLLPRYKLSLREIEVILLAKQDTRRRFFASQEITCG